MRGHRSVRHPWTGNLGVEIASLPGAARPRTPWTGLWYEVFGETPKTTRQRRVLPGTRRTPSRLGRKTENFKLKTFSGRSYPCRNLTTASVREWTWSFS